MEIYYLYSVPGVFRVFKIGRDELVMLLRWGSKEVHTELDSEKNVLESSH
jgi:hypothetical protein